MDIDTKKIDETVLALLHLTLHDGTRAWKGFDGKCCNFEDGDGGQPERNWAARSQAARSNSWSMN
jgi:hypothetical protein